MYSLMFNFTLLASSLFGDLYPINSLSRSLNFTSTLQFSLNLFENSDAPKYLAVYINDTGLSCLYVDWNTSRNRPLNCNSDSCALAKQCFGAISVMHTTSGLCRANATSNSDLLFRTVENHTAGDSRRNQKARRTENKMGRRHHQMDRAGTRRHHETDQ